MGGTRRLQRDSLMEMYWPILILIAVIGVVWRLGAARRKALQASRPPRREGRRIQGFKVLTALHPRLGRGCLFDHGLPFGEGFRNKEGPMLPHDEQCRCETVPFVFTGSEVFGGALRQFGTPQCLVPGFPAGAVKPTLEALRRVNTEPVPEQVQEYLALVRLEQFPRAVQPAVESLLRERHAHLLQQLRAQQGAQPRSAGAALEAPEAPAGLAGAAPAIKTT